MCASPARHRAQRHGEVHPEAGFWAAKDLLDLTAQGRSARHARRGAAKFTLHIGRVGALAVSLGVGLAVANAGVAYADTDAESSVSESTAEDSAEPASPPQDDTTDQSGGDTDAEPGAGEEAGEGDVDEDLDPEEVDPSADDDTDADSGEVTSPSSGASGESPDGSDDVPDGQQTPDSGVTPPDSEEPDTADAETVVNQPEDDGVGEEPAPEDAGPQTGVAVVGVVNAVSEPVEQAAAAPSESVETVDIVTTLVSTVVSPFANPDAPAQAPWFDALLAWVRRQITHTFFNKTPVYGPITTEQIFTGQLFIDLNATDPNGDPLTYEIIQPEHGLVIRDLITGNFIYTPTTLVLGEPLQDTFQVVIRDDSEHLTGALGSWQKLLHGVARLFGLAKKDNITVTIPVTINPVVQLPPTVVTAGLPIFKLGDSPVKVLSSAIITDADSDQISEAKIRIATSGQDGDVLNYIAPDGSPIAATWDATTKTLTLSGLATAEQYEQALLAVTFSATKGGLPRGVSISVTDDAGVQSLVPGAAIVTVIGLPPTVTVFGVPIFKLGGAPVKVVSSVTLGDLDSENLSEATVVIATAYQDGDVLSYTAPSGNPITASWDAASRTLTLSGVATLDQYEEAIKAVTFSTTEGGLPRGVSVSVTDDAGVQSLVPGAAIVTVIGLPPTVTVFGVPIFKLGGAPVKVVSSATLGDLDSENLSEATVVIATAYQDGDVLSYTAPSGNPITASWDAASRTLTLSGVATLDQYEEAIKAVAFSTTEGGLPRGVSVSVTDDAGVQSLVPGAAIVSVIGLPPTVTVFGVPIFKLGGSPVKVVSSVTLGDLDSENLSEATLVIATAYQDGDVLSYTAPSGNPITASWDAATRTLTLSGVATLDQYEEAIKAVTFSTTEGGLARGISVSVTDDAQVQSLVPGAAIVSVIGLPPTVTVFGVPIFKLGGAPVKVVSSVTLGDLDSENLSEATVVIATAYQDGDVLSYTAPSGNPITASWDAATRTLTLSGVATLDQYEEAIKAVTFSTTEGGLPRGVSVSVTDDAGVQSLVPGAAIVTVIGLPPTVAVFGVPIFKLGGAPVKVVSSVTLGDLDSENLSEATVVIATAYQDGDVLSYTAPSGNPITASWDAATRTLTLSGVATLDQYEEAIKAVTFSATEGGLARGISVSVTDDAQVQSLVPGAAIVSVIGLPPTVTVFGVPIFKLGGAPVKVVSSVTLGDLDSENLSEATVVIATAYQDGDVLSYTAPSGNPITASWDVATRTLTLSGVATLDQYEEAIKAVTFSTTEGGVARGISVSVTDDAQVQSLVPGAAIVSVIGLPPTVTVFGAPIFKLGGAPVKVVSSVTLGDLDSENLSEATVVIATAYQDGDVLSYTAPSGNPITASWDAATRTLTLSGVATLDQYEEAIKAVTFSTTEGGVARGISVSVTDDAQVQSLVPGAAIVSVIGLPPTVTVFGAPIFKLGGAPVKVVSSVTLGDLDSENLSEATVVIATAYQDGDVLSYTAPSGNPITASWDAATRTLTLSGVATLDQYEEAIKAVTFAATEGGLARGISIGVTDDAGVQSLVPGAAIVSVIGLPPTVTVFGVPIFKLGGAPVKVVSSVTLGDLDSENLSEATLVIATAYQDGDVLSYTAPSGNPITASWDAATRTLTLSGVATLDQYEEAIKAVTFSTTEGGVARGISVSVTDDAQVQSLVPGAAIVSVIGLPPTVTVFGAPIFKLGGAPVKVVSSVTLGDLDSENLSQATVVIATAYQDGDVLSYTAPSGNPITASWDAATRTLTLSGVATLDQYEEAIEAVTFSTTEGGLARGISVSVTDDAQVQSLVPGAAIVSVIGLPPTVTVFGVPIFKLGGAPVKVVSSVTLGDLDSENLSEATVVIATAYQDGDVLSYTAPSGNPITASWDAATRTLTLSGVATLDQYEEAIKAVTFSTTEGGLARGISVSVTDDAQVQSLVPGAAIVSVIGLPPTVTVFGVPIFKLGGAPVKVVSSVTLGDMDSENLSEATVVIATAYQDGDVLSYTAPSGNPITASWDAATRTLTLSGVATLDQYEEAIKAVTFSANQGGLSRSIQIHVSDDTAVKSLIPGSAVVTVVGLPPTVATIGAPTYTIGTAPVKLITTASIADADSDNMSQATVTIATLGQTGDLLGYVAPSGNPITATWNAATRTLTLTGVATKAQYEEALEAVTFSATGGALLVRGISITVTDDTNVDSLLPGAATANVRYSLQPSVVTVGTLSYTIGTAPVTLLSSATITDADSDKFSSARVTIETLAQSGDTLGYLQPAGSPITATWDAGSKTLTLTGIGTKAQYEEALEAVTFSATGGALLVRGISISVSDETGVASSGLLNGLATANVRNPVSPLLTTTGWPSHTRNGSATTALASASILDTDSDYMTGATVQITNASSNDVLSYAAIAGNPITATYSSATHTLTLSGTATKAQYEAALEAVKFSASQNGFGAVRNLSWVVTDDSGQTGSGTSLMSVMW